MTHKVPPIAESNNRVLRSLAVRPPSAAELRAALTAEFAPQVAELGEIIGRDLSAWSAVSES